VCFKVLPDFDQVADAEWKDFSLSSDMSYVKKIFNYFDESALEIALRLRDSLKEMGQEVECTAMTFGDGLETSFIRTLFAVGFDHVRIVESFNLENLNAENAQAEFQPAHTAERLAAHVGGEGREKYDIILTGRQAGMADSGVVPLILAERLGFPCVTEVNTVVPRDDGTLSIDHMTDCGREELDVEPPLVLVVGNSPVVAMRTATLREQLAAGKRAAATERDTSESKALPLVFKHEVHDKCCRFLDGDVASLGRKVVDDFWGRLQA
jgi:electron transfer flavoprotein beta subunit